jgi:hypothetical protein
MTINRYNKDITALLVVDPYNDFISEAAKSGLESRPLCRRPDLLDGSGQAQRQRKAPH